MSETKMYKFSSLPISTIRVTLQYYQGAPSGEFKCTQRITVATFLVDCLGFNGRVSREMNRLYVLTCQNTQSFMNTN